MYSLELRRKQCILPDKWYEKNAVFVQNRCKFPISINYFIQWSHFLFKLRISVTIEFQKTKSDVPVLIKLCLPVTSINLNCLIRVFVLFLCCHGLWSFSGFFVVCFSLILLLLSLFSLVFISGQNFISGSKDAAATQAFLER